MDFNILLFFFKLHFLTALVRSPSSKCLLYVLLKIEKFQLKLIARLYGGCHTISACNINNNSKAECTFENDLISSQLSACSRFSENEF